MSGETSPLLRALLTLRGEPVGMSEEEAGRVARAELKRLAEVSLARHFTESECDDAIQHALLQALDRQFRGDTPQEARSWARRVMINYCMDVRRKHKRAIPLRLQRSFEDEGEAGDHVELTSPEPLPDEYLEAADVDAALHRLRVKLFIAGGKKRRRIRAWLASEIDGELPPLEGLSPAEKKLALDRHYQDRKMGRQYAALIARGLELDPLERELLGMLLSGTVAARHLNDAEDES